IVSSRFVLYKRTMKRDSLNPRHIVTLPGKTLGALTGSLRYVREAKLWIQVLIAMALGIGCGVLLSPDMGFVSQNLSDILGAWIGLPGSLFLAIIQMIVVPLIFTSIIQGIASAGDMKQLKTTGL